MNVKFHKITPYTLNFQNFTCVFTILTKFEIHSPHSHEKFSLVLLQTTNYILSSWKMRMQYSLIYSGTKFLPTEN